MMNKAMILYHLYQKLGKMIVWIPKFLIIWYIYILRGGTTGTLDTYYKNLSDDFKISEETTSKEVHNNLFFEKFQEEYNKINYDSLEQTSKDILNGLMYYWADGGNYISLEKPIEKAWIVGAGENNINPQKHRKIVILSNLKYYQDAGIEMNFWLDKNNKENHNATNYFFGKNDDYYRKRGINDTASDNGIWENVSRDYYNNEKYVLLDIDSVNKTMEENKDFLVFMQEYLKIYYEDKREHELAAAEKEKEEKSKEPSIGMTKEEVLKGAWGSPKKKNITETKSGTYEQWVYGNERYIYF